MRYFVCYVVIDFCLVRQLVCDKETNYRSLRITWASKTSCNQRRGAAYVAWCLTAQIYCNGAIGSLVFWSLRLFLCILPGRAGRVSKGFCYRLVTRHFWENEIPDFTIPEMLVRERFHVINGSKIWKIFRNSNFLIIKFFWVGFDSVCIKLQRSPLASTLLKVKLLDMGDPRSVLSTALTPPNLSDIERTVLQLKQVDKA